MKIVFLCGSLEPGRDGVGDYSRQLAGELVRQGHQVIAIALYDRYITKIRTSKQEVEESGFQILRLGGDLSAKERFTEAKSKIDEFKPEWISLQYVPTSYHKKGLPLKLGRELAALGKERKWHIMFHELWIGLPEPKSIKDRIYGSFQKAIIKNTIDKLSPLMVSTTIPLYKDEYFSKDISVLPLFGNMSIQKYEESRKDSNKFIAVHFGGFSDKNYAWKLQLEWLKRYNLFRKRSLELWVIGEGGPNKKQAISTACEVFGGKAVRDLGWLSGPEISLNFQKADVGISRSGSIHFGKSGSTVSMLEHGLPVILQGKREESGIERLFEKENIYFHDDDIQEDIQRRKPSRKLTEVAELFVNDLEKFA